MSSDIYSGSGFRYYSGTIKSWLTDLFRIPRFDAQECNILSMTRTGTTDGGINQHEIKTEKNLLQISNKWYQYKPGQTVKVTGTQNNDGIYVIKSISQSGDILICDPVFKKVMQEQPSPMGSVKRCCNVVYANMERSIASIAQPLRQGTVDSPGVSFWLSDVSFKFEKSRPKENYYTRKYKDNNSGAIIGVAAVPPLLEYEIRYTINIWAVLQQEMDQMIYQIMSEFAPEKYFWIPREDESINSTYGMNYTGDRMDREHHGQWAHCILESVSDASELEPGDAQDRILRTELVFYIDNAFMPQGFDDQQSMIGALNVELEANTNKESKPE